MKTTFGQGLGNLNKLAMDAAGNLYVDNAEASAIYEFPANGGPMKTIVTGGGWKIKGLAIDAQSNLYYVDSWDSHIWKVACPNGVCGAPAILFGSIPNLNNWYFSAADIAVDGAGLLYVAIDKSIYKVDMSSGSANGTVLVSGLANTAAVAADAAGNLYFSDKTQVAMIAAGTTTVAPLAVGAYGVGVEGLSFDPAGNLYITHKPTDKIVQVPNENGALNPAHAFVVMKTGLGAWTNNVFDAFGNMYIPSSDKIYKVSFGAASIGSAAVGQTGAATSISYAINVATTPNIDFLVKGAPTTEFAASTAATNTCLIQAYNAGDTCTLEVVFAPTTAGQRRGAVVFSDGTGILNQTYVSAVGQGSGLVIDPGTQTQIGSGLQTPQGLALDGNGNIYVADAGLNSIELIPGKPLNPTGANRKPVKNVAAVGTGLSAPGAVAVDGAGNLYIADTGNNRVVEVPFTGTGLDSANQIEIATGLNGPTGIAVDGFGAIYVADQQNAQVVKITKSVLTNSYAQNTVGSNFASPTGVAVDAAGNVFVADNTNNNVIEVPAAGGSQIAVATGLGAPSAVAVDAAGSLYIAESANKRVLKVPFKNGAFVVGEQSPIGKNLAGPLGVALDPAGNVYVADAGQTGVVLVDRTQGQLSFGNFNQGTPSDELQGVFYNIGNQPLTFVDPLYTEFGDAGDFAITAPGTTGCVAGTPVATGAFCNLAAIFTPSAFGDRSAQLTIASDAANAAPIQLNLAGTGVDLMATSVNLSLVSPATGNPVFGQSIQVAADVIPAAGTNVPAGTVTFSVDGQTGQDVSLTDGSATLTITGLFGGAHTVTAKYSGDTGFAAGTSTTPLAIVVDPAPTTLTLTAEATTFRVDQGTTFTATIASAVTGLPGGKVTFSEGTTILATVDVAQGVATYTTNALTTGAHQIGASYSGDNNFATSTSAKLGVTATDAPDFGFAVGNTSFTITAGSSAATTITLTPKNGLNDKVTFSCSGLPAKTACVFFPTSVTPNGTNSPITTTVTIAAEGATNAGLQSAPMQRNGGGILFAFLAPGLMGIVSMAGGRKLDRRIMIIGGLLLIAVLVVGMTACGGSSTTTKPLDAGAPAATATVTVTATSAGVNAPVVTKSITLNLTVK